MLSDSFVIADMAPTSAVEFGRPELAVAGAGVGEIDNKVAVSHSIVSASCRLFIVGEETSSGIWCATHRKSSKYLVRCFHCSCAWYSGGDCHISFYECYRLDEQIPYYHVT